jgi:hypothetical protein
MSADDRTEDGFLILADISGFTAFVTAAELEHGAEITGALLEVVMQRLSPPLEIQELEGDAVFALGPDRLLPDGGVLPAVLGETFLAFKEEQRRLAADDGCSCRACRSTGGLDLKFVTHHGRFVRQVLGGRSRVAGPDVILVHRLLKNSVAAAAYLLLTTPALKRIGAEAITGGMRRHLVSYPHLGEVACFVADLELPEPARAG